MNPRAVEADSVGATVAITVNGQPHELPFAVRLSDLVDRLGHAPRSIATALNGDFVACGDRESRVLRDGDQVTCFQAIVGG